MNFTPKDRYTMDDLVEIMRLLRQPDGCPWDRVQTHESIRRNMIEEAYEAVDAIDRGDKAGMQEELGDVLMQVVFHAQLEREQGGFTFDDVVDGVCKKLVFRHPHVFGDRRADGAGSALSVWEAQKKIEKSQSSQTDSMRSVPRMFPALIRAAKLQEKAARSGMDWQTADQALDAVQAALDALRAHPANAAQSCGALLFAAVGAARKLQVEPEHALADAGDAFIDGFSQIETACKSEPIASADPMQLLHRGEKE